MTNSVTLSAAQATSRVLTLASRRFLTTTDHVELHLLAEVANQGGRDVSTADVWETVLTKYGYALVPYEDPDQEWQHEPYSTYRSVTMVVLGRLKQLADGESVTEDVYEWHPATDEVEGRNERLLDDLLARAAMITSFAYNHGYYDGGDFLHQLDHSAAFALRYHFATMWFGDTYSLGYAMMANPMSGLSPFGRSGIGDVVVLKSMAQTVLNALKAYRDDSLSEDVRADYGRTIALFWSMLKGAVVRVCEDMNSPAAMLAPDDLALDLIERALLQGRDEYPRSADELDLTTSRSKDGQRVERMTSETVIVNLRQRVTKEHARATARATIR